MPTPFQVVYVNRSRPVPVRAGLIQALHTAAAMQSLGLVVRMYLPPWPGSQPLGARIAEFGVREIDVRTTTFLHHRWKRWGTYRPFLLAYRRVLARADAVYTRWPDLSIALANAGIQNSLEIHNTQELVKRGELKPLIEHHRRGGIRWLIPTLHAAANFLSEAGADPARICVAPNGADLDAFADLPPIDPRRLERPRILYTGTLEAARGMNILATIAERDVAHVTLVGDQKQNLPAVPGLDTRPRVPHRQVPELYREAELVLLPYQRQLVHVDSVCPVKLFEAMAAGRPIIASDIPTIRELVEHMKTAILVDPDDTESWINAVELLKRDRDLALRLATEARKRAPQFTWRRRAQTIAQTLGWLN